MNIRQRQMGQGGGLTSPRRPQQHRVIERITNRDTKALTRLIRHPRGKRPLRLTR